MLSDRIKNIGQSPTMKIAAKAIAMKAEGIDVVDFSVGEPDFPTPRFIKDAGKKAIDDNLTRYTINRGIVPLRKAIAQKLKEDNGLDYDVSEIIVSNGAKQSLYNVVQSVVGKDDEVIIPAPYWVSYPEMVRLAQGKPVIVQTHEENGFKLTADQLRKAISANTRAIIICNPSNPTGAAYTRPELEALAGILEEEDIVVISDEIYEKLVFDDFKFTSIAALSSKIKQKTVVINGFSKAYAMTGWRIGYAAGPKDIISGADKIQSHSTSNASSVAQYAALTALNGPQYEINRMVAEFQRRRNYVVQRLNGMPGVSCNTPEGAFYVFPNVESFFGKEAEGNYIRNSYGLAYYLLREAKVALVPGAAFGKEGYIRISYATSMENLEKGLNRIEKALAKLKTPSRAKFVQLNNYKTRVTIKAPIEADLTPDKRDAIVAEAEAQLKFDQYFEWNANINGVIVQLRTNNGHLYDFWVENWYPAQLEADLEPHAVIYAVDGAVGRETHAFYHPETHTGILFNCDYYAALRSLALGMVSDIGASVFNLHSVRGMSGDRDGHGFMLIGPKGTHKSELFLHLIQEDNIALHSNDLVFVRYGGGYAAADMPERKLYFPTISAEIFPQLSALFDRSKCENVLTDRDNCQYEDCPLRGDCQMEKGMPYCYFGSPKAAAMLDPYWIGGMNKHVKRTDLRTVFLLVNEPAGAILQETDKASALTMIESGTSSGHAEQSAPFYNPHLLLTDSESYERQKRGFEQLLHQANVYKLNTGAGSPAEVVNAVVEKITK